MVELLIMLEEKKRDILNALKLKASLENKGIAISGMLIKASDSSLKFIEDLVKIPIHRRR